MGSAANPHAANPPAIAVPEPLPLPVAATIVIGHIGGAAVIAVAGSIVAGAIIIAGACDRAADDGATDDSSCQTGAKTSLRMGRRGCRHGRNSQGGDGSECHQCLSHGFTFLTSTDSG